MKSGAVGEVMSACEADTLMAAAQATSAGAVEGGECCWEEATTPLESARERMRQCAQGNSSFPWVQLSRKECAALLAERNALLALNMQAARLLRDYAADAHSEDVPDVERWLAVYDSREKRS